MEDLRPGLLLIMVVVSMILRFNGAILIWSKKDELRVLPAILLNIFSPVLCLLTVSYATGKSRSKDADSPWKGAAVMMMALLFSQFIAGMIFVGACFILGSEIPTGRALGPGSSGSSFQAIHILLMVALYSLLLFLMLWLLRSDRDLHSMFKGQKILSTTIFGFLALAPLAVAGIMFASVADKIGFGRAPALVSELNGTADQLYLFVAIVIVAPFIEELLFRGYLYDRIRKRYASWVAILVTGGLFSMAHFTPVTLLPIFILGIFMGMLRERSGSVVPSLVFHSANNLLAFILLIIS